MVPLHLDDIPGHKEGLWSRQKATKTYNARNLAVIELTDTANTCVPVKNGRFVQKKLCCSRQGFVLINRKEANELDLYFPSDMEKARALAHRIRTLGIKKALQSLL